MASIEQQVEYLIETEEVIERIELRQLYKEVEASFTKAKRTGKQHDWSVALYWFDRYNKEHERIYGEHPDEEEEIIASIEENKDKIRLPKEWIEPKSHDQRNQEGGSDNSWGGI